jgi:dUTP pyrophosphatase
MSQQALAELKQARETLESIANGKSAGLAEAGISIAPTTPSNIMTAALYDPTNTWHEYFLVQKLMDDAIVPTKTNELDAGYDLYAHADFEIEPWSSALVGTQISVGLPPGTYGRVASRSGLSVKFNLEVGAGVIDRGYTGEVKVVLRNFGNEKYYGKRGDKIAQIILESCRYCSLRVVSKISDVVGKTARGAAGFGSSGK